MSVSPSPIPARPASAGPRPNPTRRSALARAGIALGLILASGVLRAWQSGRIEASMIGGRKPAFPLAEIPTSLGSWKGTDTALDPDIVRGTGSTDLVTRRYVDQNTGVSLDVIVLYGPTADIFIHSPELCYPKAGYGGYGDGAFETSIPIPGSAPAPFRSVAYAKGEPGRLEIQEVFFSWRYNGRWSTSASTPKESQRIPGMYKVQVARRLLPRESRRLDNPAESFLDLLIPDLEARITRQAGADKPRA